MKYILHGGFDTDVPLEFIQPMDEVLSSGRPKRSAHVHPTAVNDSENRQSCHLPKPISKSEKLKNVPSVLIEKTTNEKSKPNRNFAPTKANASCKPRTQGKPQKSEHAPCGQQIDDEIQEPIHSKGNKKAKKIPKSTGKLDVPKEILLPFGDLSTNDKRIDSCSPITEDHIHGNNSYVNESDSLCQTSYSASLKKGDPSNRHISSMQISNLPAKNLNQRNETLRNKQQTFDAATKVNDIDKTPEMNSFVDRVNVVTNGIFNSSTSIKNESHHEIATGLRTRVTLREVNNQATSEARAFVKNVTGVTTGKTATREAGTHVPAIDNDAIQVEKSAEQVLKENKIRHFNTIFSSLLACREGVLEESAIHEELNSNRSERHDDCQNFTSDEVEEFLMALVQDNKIHRFDGTIYKI